MGRRKKNPDISGRRVLEILNHAEVLGHQVGFEDLKPMHGQWIRQMVVGTEDYTLQAHRGSYKSSCLAVAISLLLIFRATKNIIFLRKTDSDVAEMMGMVSKILRNPVMQDIVLELYGQELVVTGESAKALSTNLWTSPMGAPQLQGLGISSSITGKHSWYVITDDICNKDDRESRAERERTKRQYDELQNIKQRGGRIINLGTPWHKEDVFTKMPNIHRYDCYTTGLISKEDLNKLRNSMAPSLFAANYELKHIASTELLFETSPQFVNDIELYRDGIAHVDASYGGGDYTAFTCGKRDWDTGIIYLYGRLWKSSVDRVLDVICAEAHRLQCLPVYCESNGDKGFLEEEFFRKDTYASSYHEHMNKFVKISTYLRKWWPNIRFLEGTDAAYLDQILDYTINADHDDAPDSAACVCRLLDD